MTPSSNPLIFLNYSFENPLSQKIANVLCFKNTQLSKFYNILPPLKKTSCYDFLTYVTKYNVLKQHKIIIHYNHYIKNEKVESNFDIKFSFWNLPIKLFLKNWILNKIKLRNLSTMWREQHNTADFKQVFLDSLIVTNNNIMKYKISIIILLRGLESSLLNLSF